MAATEQHDTIIIGAGQAGLAMSSQLRDAGREHVILERAQVAERWHSARWDSLCLQFPNWSLQLPGHAYTGSDIDGFAERGKIAGFIENYALTIGAPIQCGTDVTSMTRDVRTDRLKLKAGTRTFEARNVVIATGPFQKPSIPACSAAIPRDVTQIHSSEYRNPEQLAPGAVLVVGSGGSGAQISEELHRSGRVVYLSVTRHRRSPRRYRGRDALAWLAALGMLDRTIDEVPGRSPPPGFLFSGTDRGHTLDLRELAASGVVLVGRLRAIAQGHCEFDSDVEERLGAADRAAAELTNAIDDYLVTHDDTERVEPEPAGHPFAAPVVSPTVIDFRAARITTVIWCTGYQHDFSWLCLPVLDERGAPRQKRGITTCRGVYFLGLFWMHKMKSATFMGVGEDAAHLAGHIAQQ